MFAVARAKVMFSHRRGEMNKTEQKYEDEVLSPDKLAGELAEYWFERLTLKLADGVRYTPDFVVQLPTGEIECHEVKGTTRKSGEARPYYSDQKGRAKIRIAADQWPFRFVVTWRVGPGLWEREEIGA